MKKLVCIVTASDMTVRAFMLDHLRELTKHYEVYVVTNSDNLNLKDEYGINATSITIPIVRAIQPLRDLRALYLLWRLFIKYRFDLVHSVTPKSGLLAMAASFMAGVKHRIHTFTGQVWVTSKGFYRLMLKGADKVIALCANSILVDSLSQQEFLISEGIIKTNDSMVLGSGSISGVNLSRFYPRDDEGLSVRARLDIPVDAIVFLFIGRLNLDKGILDLAYAFDRLAETYSDAYMMLVGIDEGGMEVKVERICSKCLNRVRFVSFTKTPEYYMNAADVFCLPSYREGFGSVVIEAGASEVPSIGSRIYGITDSIEDGVTGLLFSPGNIEELYGQMVRLIDNPKERKRMGNAAKARAEKLFSSDLVTGELVGYYKKILGSTKIGS